MTGKREKRNAGGRPSGADAGGQKDWWREFFNSVVGQVMFAPKAGATQTATSVSRMSGMRTGFIVDLLDAKNCFMVDERERPPTTIAHYFS